MLMLVEMREKHQTFSAIVWSHVRMLFFFTLQILILPMELQTLYLERQLDREDPIWDTFTQSEYDRATQWCPKQALLRVIIVRVMVENDTKGFSVSHRLRSTKHTMWALMECDRPNVCLVTFQQQVFVVVAVDFCFLSLPPLCMGGIWDGRVKHMP